MSEGQDGNRDDHQNLWTEIRNIWKVVKENAELMVQVVGTERSTDGSMVGRLKAVESRECVSEGEVRNIVKEELQEMLKSAKAGKRSALSYFREVMQTIVTTGTVLGLVYAAIKFLPKLAEVLKVLEAAK